MTSQTNELRRPLAGWHRRVLIGIAFTCCLGLMVLTGTKTTAADPGPNIDLVTNLAPSTPNGAEPTSYKGSAQMAWTVTVANNLGDDAIDVDLDLDFSRPFFHMEVECVATGPQVCPNPTTYQFTPADAPENFSVLIPEVAGQAAGDGMSRAPHPRARTHTR